MITLEQALPQLTTDLQRRLARHLAEHPGWATTERLQSEMGPMALGMPLPKPQVTSALRRLQAINFIRYDGEFCGWVR